MDKLVIGILAHVDAGKTTLSEGLLYTCGRLKKLGRVDHKDAFLDTDPMERERGITIFSKQAILPLEGAEMCIRDRSWALMLYFLSSRLVRAGLGCRSEERRVGKECRSRWSPYH